jgi:hypothetical protein
MTRWRSTPSSRASILCLALCSAVAHAQTDHWCKPNEQILFGCTLGKSAVASLCASQAFSATSGYVQYRYGPPGRLEFVYPASLQPPKGHFVLSQAMFSGGGASRVRFTNAQHEYILFDSMIRTNFKPGEPNNPSFSSGIVTRFGGKVTSRRLCTDDRPIGGAAHEHLDKEPYDYDLILEK